MSRMGHLQAFPADQAISALPWKQTIPDLWAQATAPSPAPGIRRLDMAAEVGDLRPNLKEEFGTFRERR
jgi:hypothetical protein